jgi:cellulose synthase/poly-beta-1,6-N-acetylglucosamine synthase-like glycosyltransferase
MTLADALLASLGAPLVVACGYLFLLTWFSLRPSRVSPAARRFRFDFVVPAHDEEDGIARTVQSLLEVSYPRDHFRVLVVADNCTDSTADRAREAGATVLVRQDPERRGKGYALLHAFQHSLEGGTADAVVVVDADTVVSGNLLEAIAARLALGAEAVQVDHTVLKSERSWRTRLMRIAFATVIVQRSLGRERLGLSAGLRGNGMCFSSALLRRVPHSAFSKVEDVEYAVQLGLAGVRVYFAPEAQVFSFMPAAEPAARTQRLRWESGRRAIAREYAWPLFLRGVRSRNPLLLDLALDLMVPPLSLLSCIVVAGLGASLWYGAWTGRVPIAVFVWGIAALMLLLYVVRGFILSGSGLRGLLDLAGAPFYIAWKARVRVGRQVSAHRWERTARDETIR